VPGTRIRFGLDPILGLVPGLGDAAGALLGAAILMEAYRRRMSRATLMRMAAKIILDATAGAIPLFGDLFDFVWKSNRRNLDLLDRHATKPAMSQRADRRWMATVIGVLGLICIGLGIGFALVVAAVVKMLSAP
jgi:hypothetical protein